MNYEIITISSYHNPIMIYFDPPDSRDKYESFDFWNCDILKVIDQETKQDISDRLNYDDYREIYKRIYFNQEQ